MVENRIELPHYRCFRVGPAGGPSRVVRVEPEEAWVPNRLQERGENGRAVALDDGHVRELSQPPARGPAKGAVELDRDDPVERISNRVGHVAHVGPGLDEVTQPEASGIVTHDAFLREVQGATVSRPLAPDAQISPPRHGAYSLMRKAM